MRVVDLEKLYRIKLDGPAPKLVEVKVARRVAGMVWWLGQNPFTAFSRTEASVVDALYSTSPGEAVAKATKEAQQMQKEARAELAAAEELESKLVSLLSERRRP